MSRVKDNLRKGRNSKINGILEQYKVSSSGNISAGDFIKFIKPNTESISIDKIRGGEVEINSKGIYNGEYQVQKFVYDSTSIDSIVNTDEVVSVALDDKRALILYRDPDNNMAGTTMIATMVDNKLEYGDRYVFNPDSISDITATLFDTDKVLVVFTNQSNNGYGVASILQIKDNGIELKNSVVFNPSSTLFSKATTLTTGQVLVVFGDVDSNRSGACTLININEYNSINITNKVAFTLESINYLDVSTLSENKAVVVYSSENTYNGNANVIDVKYNSIDVGPTYTLNLDLSEDEQDIAFISTDTIDSNNIVIGYRKTIIDDHDHNYYAIVTANINGNEVKLGSKKVLNTDACNLPITVNTMIDNKVLSIYQSFTEGVYYLNATVVTIDSNNVILDNMFTTPISNYLISSTLSTINLNKYNCMVFTKSEVDEDTNNFDCYNIEMTPTKSYNVYNGTIENTDISNNISISGNFSNIDTIVVDKKTIMVPYIEQTEWNIEGKQVSSNAMCYLLYTNDENKPLSQWNELSKMIESDINIGNINGVLLRKNKVVIVYSDKDNSVAKYVIINVNKDTDENAKLFITNKGVFVDDDVYMGNTSLIRIDDNRVLLAYRSEKDYSVKARIMTINTGDSITLSNEHLLSSAIKQGDPSPINISAVTVDNNKIYITYTLGENTNIVTGKLLIIDENNNVDNIFDRDFSINNVSNIYENRLMYLEPNTVIQSSEVVVADGIVNNTYDMSKEDNINISTLRAGAVINCPYTGRSKEIELPAGKYKLECWGAQGGDIDSEYIGGLGGYSTGVITLEETTKVYLYSGGKGKYMPIADNGDIIVAGGGFNGGGPSRVSKDDSNNLVGGGSGGGGTDIRIGLDSLYSRVIVAGGGSGASHSVHTSYNKDNEVSAVIIENYDGRHGGGLSGEGDNLAGKQNEAGYNPEYLDGNGNFGTASTYVYNNIKGGQTGAGGGWYSGANTISPSNSYANYNNATIIRSGGGSGYVYNEHNVSNYPSGCLLSSNYYLEEALTLDGNSKNPFVDPESGESVDGRYGDGYIRITILESEYEDDQPVTRYGSASIVKFEGESISVHDTASIVPTDTGGVNNINILKVDKDLNRTLLLTTYNHVSKDNGLSNPLVVPGNVSLNYDKDTEYQLSFIGTNKVFSHNDSYNTLYQRSELLNKDLIVSARTNRVIDDKKHNHASTLELQTFKIHNEGIDNLEKYDVLDINKKYITNSKDGSIKYLSFDGIKISNNKILAISSVSINNSYSGICELFTISNDRKDIVSRSEKITFCTARINNIKSVMIDINKVLISFNTTIGTNPGLCYAIVGEIEDNTVVFGDLFELDEYDLYASAIEVLSANRVLMTIGNTLKVLYAEYDNSISELASITIDNDSMGIGGLEESNFCPKDLIKIDNMNLLLTYAITDIAYCAVITVDSVNNIFISDRELLVEKSTIVQNGNNTIYSILLDNNKVLLEYILKNGDEYSIYSNIVNISKGDITVKPKTLLAENVDPLQCLNLYNVDNNALFTYVKSTDGDCVVNYGLLLISEDNITIRNIYEFENVYTTVPFTNSTLINEDTILLYTKVTDNDNINCKIVYNMINNISKYTKGFVKYQDTLVQNSITPIMDYEVLTDDIAESVDTIKLTDTKIFVTYIDSFTKYGIAKIVNVVDNRYIDSGDKYTIYDTLTSNIRTQLLEDGRILIMISDIVDDNKAKFIIATINENEISFTEPITRSSLQHHSTGTDFDMTLLSDNRVFIAYEDGTYEIISIEGDNIAFTFIDYFDQDDTCILSNITLQTVHDTRVLLLYKSSVTVEESSLNSIKAVTIDIRKDNINIISDPEAIYQTDKEFDGTMSIVQTDMYKYKYLLSINSLGYLIVISALDRISVNMDLAITFDTNISTTGLVDIGNNEYLVLYSNEFGGKCLLVNVDGLEINEVKEYTFDNSKINYLDTVYLTDNKIFIILNETVMNTDITSASTLLFNIDKNVVVKYDGIDKPNGIAKTDGLVNGVIDVYITGNIQQ